MATMSDIAARLLQAGLVIGSVLIAQALTVRRLPLHDIPPVLHDRVALSNRLRPWLLGAATALVSAGLVLAVD